MTGMSFVAGGRISALAVFPGSIAASDKGGGAGILDGDPAAGDVTVISGSGI
jgi:hypothetical protein